MLHTRNILYPSILRYIVRSKYFHEKGTGLALYHYMIKKFYGGSMKKLVIVLLMFVCIASIFALPERLVVMQTADFLRTHVANSVSEVMLRSGDNKLEAYYYNDKFVILGMDGRDLAKYPAGMIQKTATLPLQDRIYLVSRIPKRAETISPESGEIFFDLGDSFLLRSPHNSMELRTRIISPFNLFEFRPIVFRVEMPIPIETVTPRTEVVDLISYVNPDSIMWFIQNLQNFQTRYALAPNRLAVSTWIRDQFIRMGITNAHIESFDLYGYTQYNVVATIPGTVHPDKYIIVGGHHDSITQTNPMNLAPGADDNATGTATALEMARVMMTTGFQPKNTIRFVTYAAEELGLWGSKDHAENALVAGDDIILMINQDMIGYSPQAPGEWEIMLMPYDGSINQTLYAAQVAQQYTSLIPVYGYMNSAGSDSHSYWVRGYPVTYFFERYFCPYYHTEQDIIDYVNADYCAEVIRASTALAALYSRMPAAPTGLVINDTGSGNSLRISWQNSVDTIVQSYRIYYNTLGYFFDNPITVNSMPGEESWYEIQGLETGTLYYIAVSALDLDGNESYMIFGEGIPNDIPLTPASFTDYPGFGNVELRWQPNQELDLAGYRLFRSAVSGGEEQVLANLHQNNIFVDSNPLPDNAYMYYRLVAVDLDGNESPSTEIVRSRAVSLNSGVLVVDETLDGSGVNPFQPTGEQVYSFIDGLISGFAHSTIDLETGDSVRLSDIGIYQSIFWHGFDQSDYETLFQNRDDMKRYLELGGKLFLTSYYPTRAIASNGDTPVTYAADSYISSVFGIGASEFANAARFKYALPETSGFPALTVDPQKTTASLNGHIIKVESISATPEATNIYYFGSDYEDGSSQGALNGLPIGVYYDLNPGIAITISFPLYNMDELEARTLVQYVFGDIFGAEVFNSDPTQVSSIALSLRPNYPNPFVNTTNIGLETKDKTTPLQVEIYNLKGQLVQSIWNGISKSGTQNLQWNGLDYSGKPVATGIYFVRAKQGNQHTVRKVMKLK